MRHDKDWIFKSLRKFIIEIFCEYLCCFLHPAFVVIRAHIIVFVDYEHTACAILRIIISACTHTGDFNCCIVVSLRQDDVVRVFYDARNHIFYGVYAVCRLRRVGVCIIIIVPTEQETVRACNSV